MRSSVYSFYLIVMFMLFAQHLHAEITNYTYPSANRSIEIQSNGVACVAERHREGGNYDVTVQGCRNRGSGVIFANKAILGASRSEAELHCNQLNSEQYLNASDWQVPSASDLLDPSGDSALNAFESTWLSYLEIRLPELGSGNTNGLPCSKTRSLCINFQQNPSRNVRFISREVWTREMLQNASSDTTGIAWCVRKTNPVSQFPRFAFQGLVRYVSNRRIQLVGYASLLGDTSSSHIPQTYLDGRMIHWLKVDANNPPITVNFTDTNPMIYDELGNQVSVNSLQALENKMVLVRGEYNRSSRLLRNVDSAIVMRSATLGGCNIDSNQFRTTNLGCQDVTIDPTRNRGLTWLTVRNLFNNELSYDYPLAFPNVGRTRVFENASEIPEVFNSRFETFPVLGRFLSAQPDGTIVRKIQGISETRIASIQTSARPLRSIPQNFSGYTELHSPQIIPANIPNSRNLRICTAEFPRRGFGAEVRIPKNQQFPCYVSDEAFQLIQISPFLAPPIPLQPSPNRIFAREYIQEHSNFWLGDTFDSTALQLPELYCNKMATLRINGISDWRLPTLSELTAIRETGAAMEHFIPEEPVDRRRTSSLAWATQMNNSNRETYLAGLRFQIQARTTNNYCDAVQQLAPGISCVRNQGVVSNGFVISNARGFSINGNVPYTTGHILCVTNTRRRIGVR